MNLYKPICQTPYQVIKKLRESQKINQDTKLGYAGRLDPLASGVLLLMMGESCKNRDTYQNNDKTYIFNLVFGIETDSLDPLGLIRSTDKSKITIEQLEKVIKQFKGEIVQRYPLFSSYAINGVPMYKLAREGKISDSDRPEKSVVIKNLKVLNLENIDCSSYIDSVKSRVSNVVGIFRQDEILSGWDNVEIDTIQVASIEAQVGSGTYIRSLAEDIAKKLNTLGIADSIVRTQVGEYSIEDSLRI